MAETDIASKLISPAAVLRATSLSRSTIWRMVSKGQFPSPVRISSNRIAWRQVDLDAWLASRMADPTGQAFAR